MLTGSIDFGGGADILALSGTSAFHGTLANSSAATANVGAEDVGLTGTGAANLASLTTGAGATLGVSIGQGTSSLFNISGVADFGAGTKVQANLLSLGDVAGTYQIIQAGTLNGWQPGCIGRRVAVPLLEQPDHRHAGPGLVAG